MNKSKGVSCGQRRTTKIEDLKFDQIKNLIENLKKNYHSLWNIFLADNDIYIDIRKDKYIEVYCSGASICKLEWLKRENKIQSKIHEKYIDNIDSFHAIKQNLNKYNKGRSKKSQKHYCAIDDIKELKNNINQIKKNIKKQPYSNNEKEIQGAYAVNKNKLLKQGIILDTEFAFNGHKYKSKRCDIRIDMVYLRIDKNIPKLYFVELKTKSDNRLDIKKCEESNKKREKPIKHIQTQLEEYTDFTNKYEQKLKEYYTKLFKIKYKYKLLSKFNINIVEQIKENIENLQIVEKPILLIDCVDEKEFKNKVDLLSRYDLSSCCLKICNKLEN